MGFGKKVHEPAFRSHPYYDVVVVSKDWRSMVKSSSIDAISIAVPPSFQPRIVMEALRNGKHVFCEKPIAQTTAEAVSMCKAARKYKRANMVDFEFPEIPSWGKARELLKKNTLGAIRHVEISWSMETYANKMGLTSWKTESRRGGGALYSFASHVFYNLEWFLGPVSSLRAKLCSAKDLPGSGDTLDMLQLEMARDVPVSAIISTHSFLGEGHHLRFYGEKGALILKNQTSDYVYGFQLFAGKRADRRLKQIGETEHSPFIAWQDGRIWAVSKLVGRFAEWIQKGKRTPGPNFEDGLRVQKLLEKARESNRKGSWVNCRG